MSNQQNFQNQQAGGVSTNPFNQQFTEADNRQPKMQPYGTTPYVDGTYGVPGMYPYHQHFYGYAPYHHGHFYHPYGHHHHFGWHQPGYGYPYFHPYGTYGYGHYPYFQRDFSYNYQQPFANDPVQEGNFNQEFTGTQYNNQVNPGAPFPPVAQPQFSANANQGFYRTPQQASQVIQGTSTPVRKDRKGGVEPNSFRGTDVNAGQQSTSSTPQQ